MHQRESLSSFNTPFQVALFRRMRAYRKYSNPAAKQPPPPRIPAADLFEAASGSKMPQKGKSDPKPPFQALHLSIPTARKHIAISTFC